MARFQLGTQNTPFKYIVIHQAIKYKTIIFIYLNYLIRDEMHNIY